MDRSFYDKIKSNVDAGLHTLCLLDIKTKEPDYDRMVAYALSFFSFSVGCLASANPPPTLVTCRGAVRRTRSREEIYLPPRFMSVNLAVEQLLEIEERRKEGGKRSQFFFFFFFL